MNPSQSGQIEIFGRKFRSRKVAFWLLVGPLLLWFLWATILVRFIAAAIAWIGKWDFLAVSDTFPTLGQTGDIFGGVNALFAAYAFVGVAVAAFFQHRTFQLVEEQQRQQSFEPMFFKLLEWNRAIRPESIQGSPLGNSMGQLVLRAREELGRIEYPDRVENAIHAIQLEYQNFYKVNEAALGPYMRTLYQVFKFIDGSGLPPAARIQYANIARASVDRDELVLLMMACAAPQGTDFKLLVEKYGLLKHLPSEYRTFGHIMYKSTALLGTSAREGHWRQHPAERPPGM
jgi:hypothetical protein